MSSFGTFVADSALSCFLGDALTLGEAFSIQRCIFRSRLTDVLWPSRRVLGDFTPGAATSRFSRNKSFALAYDPVTRLAGAAFCASPTVFRWTINLPNSSCVGCALQTSPRRLGGGMQGNLANSIVRSLFLLGSPIERPDLPSHCTRDGCT